MTDNLFVPSQTIDPTKDYSQELVGEGKKFADPAALARSKVEGDLHIRNLETEMAELRADLGRRTSVEEAIKKLQPNNTQNSSQPNEVQPSASGSETGVAIKQEDISKLVQNELAKQSSERTAQDNVELIKAKLTEVWGADYVQKLKAKAVELGVSEENITGMAKTMPRALLQMVGANEVQKQNTEGSSLFTPSQNGINTAALQSRSSNTPEQEKYSYWSKVRKENPTFYHSIEATRARHEAMQKHGQAFLNT